MWQGRVDISRLQAYGGYFAISFLLGVADRSGYEGEPAMLLESVVYGGDDVLKLEPRIILYSRYKVLIEEIFCSMKRFHTMDLAYSAHVYMAKGLLP